MNRKICPCYLLNFVQVLHESRFGLRISMKFNCEKAQRKSPKVKSVHVRTTDEKKLTCLLFYAYVNIAGFGCDFAFSA